MSFPRATALEKPILQELAAIGGAEDLRFLYERLLGYFPQISEVEIQQIRVGKSESWRKLVQRAGKELDAAGFLKRQNGFWTITEKGIRETKAETEDFQFSKVEQKELSHREIQKMLGAIGEKLTYSAELEFEYYDVVWRVSPKSQRISHVFEVQSKGNIDSAFTKLKRAYDAQRSKPFLILASERDLNRARREISFEKSGAFHELAEVLTILSFEQIRKTYQSLDLIGDVLSKFLDK